MTTKARAEKGDGSLFCDISELPAGRKTPVPFFDTLESGTVIGLEIRPGGVNHLTPRHKDDVYGFRGRMSPK